MQIQGKRIHTVVSDMDGTLLKEERMLSPTLFPLLRRLKEEGVAFVAASGRQYDNMRLLFDAVWRDMDFICENGSMIVCQDEIVYKRCIPRDLAERLINDMLTVEGAEALFSSEGKMYVPDRESVRRQFGPMVEKQLFQKLHYVKSCEDVPGQMNKISIWWKKGIPEEWAHRFHEKYDEQLHAVDSGNGWMDFTMGGANKGEALKELARIRGFSLEETLCFGDSENDISMFRTAGVAAVMETAAPHVKAEADLVCADVEETLRSLL